MIMAYIRDIQPFSLAPYSLQDAVELSRFLQADPTQLARIDTFTIVKAFVECVMVAHGCRQLDNGAVSAKYGDRAYQTLVSILKHRLKAPDILPHLGALLSGMDLLSFFLVGSDDLLRARFVISEAYRIFTIYEKHIPKMTAHRIFVLKIGAAIRNVDIVYLLNGIKKLGILPDHFAGIACFIALVSCLVGRHPSRTESSSVAPTMPSLAAEDIWIREQALEIIASTENGMAALERTLKPSVNLSNLFRTYTAILIGARCICYWQLGYVNQAATEAAKLLEMGPAPPVRSFASFCSL